MIIEEFKNKKNFNKIKKFLIKKNINFKEVKLDSDNYLINSSKIKQEVFDDLNEKVLILNFDTEYQLCTRKFNPENTEIKINDEINLW